jgi:L-asparaginase
MSPLIDSANMTPAYWLRLRAPSSKLLTGWLRRRACPAWHRHSGLQRGGHVLSTAGLAGPGAVHRLHAACGRARQRCLGNVSGACRRLAEGQPFGVQLYFHGQLMAPTRCAKVRSFGRHPFVALARNGGGTPAADMPGQLFYTQPKHVASVGVLPLVPGIGAPQLDALLNSGLEALVLECFGSGTGPSDNPAFPRQPATGAGKRHRDCRHHPMP